MKFTFKKNLIFVVGLVGLLCLGLYKFNEWSNMPKSPLPFEKPTVPDLFKRSRILQSNGLIFKINRERQTVNATNMSTGELVWESQGQDKLIIPGAAFPIDLSPSGELWVANVGRKRLEQLNPATGQFIASWQPKESFGGCCNPVRFAALSNGRFLTMEKGTRKACIYSPSGDLERIVSNALSGSEENYYLYHSDQTVHLFDNGTILQLEVPND